MFGEQTFAQLRTGLTPSRHCMASKVRPAVARQVLDHTIIIIIHSFYIALFSALKQTHCAHLHVILNE